MTRWRCAPWELRGGCFAGDAMPLGFATKIVLLYIEESLRGEESGQERRGKREGRSEEREEMREERRGDRVVDSCR